MGWRLRRCKCARLRLTFDSWPRLAKLTGRHEQHVTNMVIGRAFVDIAHGGGGIGEEVRDDLVFGLTEPVGSGVRLAEDYYWEVVFAVDLILVAKNIIECWRERLSNAV